MSAAEAKELVRLKNQHAQMRHALQRIKAYMPPAKLRKQCQKEYGLEGDEALEMAYENVLAEAKAGLKGIK